MWIGLRIFETDICKLVSPTLCDSSEILDDSLRFVLEKHTHVYSNSVPANRNDPWYKAVKRDNITARNIDIGQKDSALKNTTSINKEQSSKAKKSMDKNMS